MNINLNPLKVSRMQKAIAFMRREPMYRTLAALLATMRITADPKIPMAKTDCVKHITYNPEYVDSLETTEEAAAILVHETLHKFGLFHIRLDDWAKAKLAAGSKYTFQQLAMAFNKAHDYLINYSIKHDWRLPIQDNWLYNDDWSMQKYTVEQLATFLLELESEQGDGEEEGDDGDGADGGQGKGGGGQDESDSGDESAGNGSGDDESDENGDGGGQPDNKPGSGDMSGGDDVEMPEQENEEDSDGNGPMSESQRNEMEATVKRDIASATRAAKGIGVDPSDFFHKMMSDSVQAPTASLAKEMNRLASELNRSGHTSWVVPHRKRKLPNGFAMPGPRDVKLGTIVAVVDSSGSTTGKTCKYFLNTLVKTVQNVDYNELVILHCDTYVRKVLRYTKRQAKPGKIDTQVYGGGGTAFLPAFRWIKENIRGKVSAMVYMTDGGTMHSDVMYSKEIWEQKRYPLLWALYSEWPCVDTFINWVHVNDRFGRVCRLPADKA